MENLEEQRRQASRSDSTGTPRSSSGPYVRYLLTPPIAGTFTPAGQATFLELGLTSARLQHRRRLYTGDRGMVRLSSPGGTLQAPGEVLNCVRIDADDSELPFVSTVKTTVAREMIDALVRYDHAAPIEELRETDRFTLSAPQPASFVNEVLVLDLSESGARIQHRQQISPRARSAFRMSLPGGLAFKAAASVMWSRLLNDGKEIHYLAGVRFEVRQTELKRALWRLHEQQLVRPDVEGLRNKLGVTRSRAVENARRLRQFSVQRAIDPETVLLVRHVRQQLRSHPQEAARWYNKAKFSDVDPAIRELIEGVPFREEMLAIWEYLDRSVDPRQVIRICTSEP